MLHMTAALAGRRRRLGLVFMVALLCLAPTANAQLPPGSLWQVVDSLCVPAKQASADPLPCLEVDLERGLAVLAADAGHLLVVPTRRIPGIESSELLGEA